MRRVAGEAGARFIAAGIAVSTFGFLNLVILVTPRVYQAMAADGLFFRRAAALHPRFRTPVAALVFQAAWAVALTLSGTYGQLLDYVVFGDWIFFGLAGVALIVFRIRERSGGMPPAPFRSPAYPVVPVVFTAAAMATVLSSVLSNPRNAAIGVVLIAAGIPAYAAWRRFGPEEDSLSGDGAWPS
jgi:APA family basic amino acid/polyamine antiporter